MTRKKVILEYIPNDKTRCGTFKTRNHGLMKKAGDVAIMCKAKTCVIVYPEGELDPLVFPSHNEAVAILNRFRSMEDDVSFSKKMDQEGFLVKRVAKIQEEALKSKRDLEEHEIMLLLHKARRVGHVGLSMEEITHVGCNADLLQNSIREQITKIRGERPVYLPYLTQTPTPNVTGGMETIGVPMMSQAQAPTPYVTGDMDATGAPSMYQAQELTPYVTGGMETIGDPPMYQSHAPNPYATGGMETIGAPMVYQAQESSQQHEEWLNLMRSGGGDLGTLVCDGFNGGAIVSSATRLSGNQMIPPLGMGAWFGFPWGSADPNPSSSAFRSM